MAAQGWISLSRSIKDHWLWSCEFSLGQAWIDLLLNANHSDAKIMIKGQLLNISRGQQARSEVTLAGAWSWSRGRVRRFLSSLEADHMITVEGGHLTSVITICNYNDFQSNGRAIDTPNNTAVDTAGDTASVQQAIQQANIRRYTNNNENNVNNEDNANNVNNENKSVSGKPNDVALKKEANKEIALNVLNHLNNLRCSNFKPTPVNIKLIIARLEEGHSEKEITDVIDMKNEEWSVSTKMEKFIRPATLFNAEKFNQYVGVLSAHERDNDISSWIPVDGNFNTIDGEVIKNAILGR